MSNKSLMMDSTKMAAEVREWLEESGILKEMQARLRAKMIERLMDKNRKGSRLKTKHASQPRGSAALNSLFLEHLLHTKLWYTAAVFTREATDDFGCEDRYSIFHVHITCRCVKIQHNLTSGGSLFNMATLISLVALSRGLTR